jgi:hypothetical protein
VYQVTPKVLLLRWVYGAMGTNHGPSFRGWLFFAVALDPARCAGLEFANAFGASYFGYSHVSRLQVPAASLLQSKIKDLCVAGNVRRKRTFTFQRRVHSVRKANADTRRTRRTN